MYLSYTSFLFFFFNDTATTEIYTLSLHDALPICHEALWDCVLVSLEDVTAEMRSARQLHRSEQYRSEEHTSELQSHSDLVCRLLLEKKKKYHQQSLLADRQCSRYARWR